MKDIQPESKEPIKSFVDNEDDLSPAVIMNLKWLDAYRYRQKSIYSFLELI